MPYEPRPEGVYVAPHLVEEVHRVLAAWRKENGWEPGMVWNPRAGWDAKARRGGRYEWPQEGQEGSAAT